MAYKAKNLSVLAYANGFTQWHYAAEKDSHEVVESCGYFDDAADMLRKGDLLFANVSSLRGFLILWVAESDQKGVEVAKYV